MSSTALFILMVCAGLHGVSCCSCAWPPLDINDTVDSFLETGYNNPYVENIYTGIIKEALCKCWHPRAGTDRMFDWKCLKFSNQPGLTDARDGSGSLLPVDDDEDASLAHSNNNSVGVQKKFVCEHGYGLPFGFIRFIMRQYNCESLPGIAFGGQSYGVLSSDDVETVDSCRFRGFPQGTAEDCDMSFQPCTYNIQVKEVFKGNYTVGDIIRSNGPMVLTSCTREPMLEVGQPYVIGIGSYCSRFHRDWTKESWYEDYELEKLRSLQRS